MKQEYYSLKSTIVAIFASILLSCGNTQNSDNYRINITDPDKDGAPVYKICTTIRGTAFIPASDYLWVLLHRKDLTGQWWPQDGGIVKDNQFNIRVCFGQPQDLGMEFEIAVITVGQAEHLVLQNYVKTARQTGNWYFISIPPVTSPATFRTIKKTGHQL